MIKLLITDYKKVNIYGDIHLTEDGYYQPFRGKKIIVKILGLFWITYKYYIIK